MKPLPRYWALHHEIATLPEGAVPLSASGSSDLSQEDAERDARERFAALVAAGGPRKLRERGEYYPDRRRPEELLEEIFSPEGALIAAITRNRYGAAVLNTDAMLIADVDLPTEPADQSSAGSGGLLGRLFGRGRTGSVDANEEDPDLRGEPGHGRRGEEHRQALAKIGQFCADHPDLGVRTYRTRNVFRLLVTGTGADPGSTQSQELLSDLGSDELYTLLCRVHDTYRARLSPKPWRLGLAAPATYGQRAVGTKQWLKWVADYDAASADVAVCRFIGSAGPAPSDVEQQVIELHDRAVRHESGLRLA